MYSAYRREAARFSASEEVVDEALRRGTPGAWLSALTLAAIALLAAFWFAGLLSRHAEAVWEARREAISLSKHATHAVVSKQSHSE